MWNLPMRPMLMFWLIWKDMRVQVTTGAEGMLVRIGKVFQNGSREVVRGLRFRAALCLVTTDDW